MKLTSETKLMLGLIVFVVLGAGALFALSNAGKSPNLPPVEPPRQLTRQDFEEYANGARHIKGPESAKIWVVEFADFECGSCRRAHANLTSRFGKDLPVRFFFRHRPLPETHPMAIPAAVASEAAARQGKFWEMYNALMRDELAVIDEAFIRKAAQQAGLDLTRFDLDRKDPALMKLVTEEQQFAESHQIEQTPTFIALDTGTNEAKKISVTADMQNYLAEKGLKVTRDAAAAADPAQAAGTHSPDDGHGH